MYRRLVIHQNEGAVLHFDTIAAIALNKDDTMDEDKMRELVRLCRPNRQGVLSEIDFLKSIDSLYKEFRLLQATITNSGSMDRAFEIMINYAFYVVLWCIILVSIEIVAFFAGMYPNFLSPVSYRVSLASIP